MSPKPGQCGICKGFPPELKDEVHWDAGSRRAVCNECAKGYAKHIPMKTYCTEYRICGELYGDLVEADSWDEAQRICNERRPYSPELVTGELVEQIPVDDEFMMRMGAWLN